MKAYTAKNGATQYKASAKAIARCINGDNSTGWCLACGKTQSGTEPDARKYTCHCCGAAKVYGGEELMLMGLIH